MNNISRKKIFFITGVLGLVALFGILAFVLISDNKETIDTVFGRPTPTPVVPTPAPESVATATIKLALLSPTSVAVFVDPKDELISAVQLQLQYDVNVLDNIDITPGTLIPNALVLTKKIDPTKGTIFYALAVRPDAPPLNAKGTVAIISFQKKSLETTKISFLPLTKITSFGIDQSILQTATEIEIQ